MNTHEKIRAERKKQRYTIAQLAVNAGISKATLEKAERATTKDLYFSTVKKIATALGIRTDDLR